MQREISINQPQLTQQRDLLAALFSTLERTVTGLCGCWHTRMSWPVTHNGRTLRSCLKCGMCRRFDPDTWKTYGPFYRRD